MAKTMKTDTYADGSPRHHDPTPAEVYPIKNAVTCGICQSLADRYENRFECQRNPAHVGDLIVGVFSDLSYPAQEAE